ncbi:hypothetical protein FRACYDRAFT_244988 [Fragilariopsis cylindrus CCMP1102]|uniref:Uncharacterized protein n=1 Tax=Fragilariopsis cylindrus CCMP1102 TaxID=635003 RepID=A0A1E7F100_9STRA|nr:hypothetical protein FRACYDRAFT_244988 [Fragilariopsis cylindrus CCMP1102]|eukprot:OEU11868.1 hypothetical protein FRACYDRAFT_244988 [Fragilariopsis cylindrus CCMP1102]
MATTRKGNKKTARSISGISTGVEGGNDSKRPHNISSASESNNNMDTTNNNDDNEDNNRELPTPAKLSKELSKIVSDRYSRDESLRALKNLYTWALTQDVDFLKLFHIYAGIVRVVDFLNATMNDIHCKGSIRMECIENAADVIMLITFKGENAINNEVATKNVATLLDCDGVNTLIAASEEYTGGKAVPQLKAVHSVWRAFTQISDSLMIQDTAITIFGTGIDIMSQLKSVDGDIASKTLEHVFHSLCGIVYHDRMTKKYFQDKNILPKCLEVFKKNGTWNFRSCEELIHKAVVFFNICRTKNLLDESSDYEMILPLLVVALKKFPSNDKIRGHVVNFLNNACSSEANNKKTILRSGVMEPLVLLLASDEINDENWKDKVRTLISKIIA